MVMAEFLNQVVHHDEVYEEGFGNMGKPIPDFRKDEAYRVCREEWKMSSASAMSCVTGCALALERDRPHEAMSQAMRYIDLTATYRLFAILLTHPDPKKVK